MSAKKEKVNELFPKIGNLAPSFSLLDEGGEEVALKDFRNKKNVVLYFYPKAMTPGCTTQACGIRDWQKEWEKWDTVVFGISPDSVPRLAKFKEKEELNFSLLSDPEHQVAEKYGVWGEKMLYGRKYWGVLRTTFIIGKDGRLSHIIPQVKPATHHHAVLEYLQQNL